MKSINVKSGTYISFDVENNDTDPKFKVGDYMRISKQKNISAKINIPNWSEKVLVVKNIVLWTYVINDLNGEEIALKFHKKESPKTNQRKFRIEKVIRKKGNKLYLKWTDYDNTFNNWIDMNDVL